MLWRKCSWFGTVTFVVGSWRSCGNGCSSQFYLPFYGNSLWNVHLTIFLLNFFFLFTKLTVCIWGPTIISDECLWWFSRIFSLTATCIKIFGVIRISLRFYLFRTFIFTASCLSTFVSSSLVFYCCVPSWASFLSHSAFHQRRTYFFIPLFCH
jgi:hypothetical protein